MQALEPDFGLVMNELEKKASTFSRENSVTDEEPPKRAPIYDGAELHLVKIL